MPDLVFPEKEFNQLSRDERFLRRLKNIVETNLGDEQFGVEDVAEALAMSRTQVYRRLHKITGKNINQYIRETRLERALELLKKDVANVAEIAYQVGFGSPAYFNKCFHDHYGFPPGEIIKKYQEEGKFPDLIPAKMRDEKKYILFGKKKIIRRDRFMLYMVFILLLFGFITIGISYLFKIYNADLQSNLNKKETLVVFPIRNDDSYQQDDYLLASIQEEILKRLQKIERLRVYSSQPVGQSENNQENLSSILEELDVSYRLESSGRLYSDSLHLHTILMDSRTNIQIWEETYEVPLITDSVFRLQNRIAETVAHSLGTEFILEEGKSIDSRHRVPIEAQRLAMRGRGELNNFFDGLGRHHADSAMKFFDQTLAIDPEYALAVACKGEVFMHRDRNFDSAIYYCMKAIQLDQEEGFSYWILGECYKKMELFDLSIENYLKAYEVYPYVPGPNMNLGYLYITKKQDVINGLPYLKLSLEQRPLDELNQLVASECYSYMGDYEKAKEHALKSFNLGHKYTSWGIQCYHGALVAMNKFSEDLQFLDSICNIKDCEDNLFNIYWALHLNMEDFEMAENRYEKLIEKGGRLELYDSIFLAYMYQQLGQEENYRNTINHCQTRCEDLWNNDKKNSYNIGNLIPLYAVLGEGNKALYYMSEFEKTGLHFNIFEGYNVSPLYESIRDEPEYKNIINRVNEKKTRILAQISEIERQWNH